jgi:hypothetical protein
MWIIDSIEMSHKFNKNWFLSKTLEILKSITSCSYGLNKKFWLVNNTFGVDFDLKNIENINQ